MSTRTKHRAATAAAAALLAALGAALALVAYMTAANISSNWGDLTTVGLVAPLLAAWAAGTLIFTPRRHR